MDTSAINSILSAYGTLVTKGYSADSSSLASKLTSHLLKNRDSDGDGYLTNSDVSELSSKEFSKLDTDRDGKLGTTEINTAFKGQMDSILSAAHWSKAAGNRTISALRNTPAGKLMQAINTPASTSSSSSTSTKKSSSSSSGSSILDVTA